MEPFSTWSSDSELIVAKIKAILPTSVTSLFETNPSQVPRDGGFRIFLKEQVLAIWVVNLELRFGDQIF